MTVVIPDDSSDDAGDDTTVVVAPVIVNDTGDDDSAAVEEAVEAAEEAEEAAEVAVDISLGVSERLGSLESRVSALETAAVITAVDDTPDVVIEEEGDGDVIVTGDESPVGVPWTHKKPSLFGSR